MSSLPDSLFERMKPYRREQYDRVTQSQIEQVVTEFFSQHREEIEELFAVTPMTPQQVDALTARPESPYHKILDGYLYSFDLETTVWTGAGGARNMYKSLLEQGMSEEMIERTIYVSIGSAQNAYPLAVLTVKQKS